MREPLFFPADRQHQGAPAYFFVVIGRNRDFPPTEIPGRFLAASARGAVNRARREHPELTSGLQLEAFRR